MTYSKIKKAIASTLIVAILAPYLVQVDFSYGENIKNEHDLVVLLVEKNLYTTGNENKTDTLTGKIYRYADDIRKKLSNTKTKIIRVDTSEHPSKITALLEKYYLEGEKNSTQTEINKLRGVIIVGDIPLPVVQHKAHFIPTIFPYVDFIDPAFFWNEQSRQYEENPQNIVPQAEIWHGLIQAPEPANAEGNLKTFFDKNHAFHTGKIASDFDQKIFYLDILDENDRANSSLLENYYLRREYTEDLAYLRFNKYFAQKVLGQFSKNTFPYLNIDDDGDGAIDEDPLNLEDDDGDGLVDEDYGDIYKNIDNDNDGSIDEDEADGIDNDGDGSIDEDVSVSPLSSTTMEGMPDLQSKKIIEKFLSPYAEIVQNYVNNMISFVEGSGRWTEEQIDSFPALITKLDALFLEANAPPTFRMSLKNVNTYMEDQLDELVKNFWQKDLELIDSITVQKKEKETTEEIVYKNYINGTDVALLATAEDCALSHGSSQIENMNLAQQVEYNRTYAPDSAGNPTSACLPYGNCCGNHYSSPEKCNPDNAYQPVKHIVANVEKSGLTNALACKKYNFYSTAEKKWYSANIGSISEYSIKKKSSLFKHDEPRATTLMNALSNQNVNPNLPSDDPRYISFQNNGRRITEIDYLNFFKVVNKSENNNLTTIKKLIKQKLTDYQNYINNKITEQNLDIFKEYLYRYIAFYSPNYGFNTESTEITTLSITPTFEFENNFTNWKNKTFNFLKTKFNTTDNLNTLTEYLQNSPSNYDSELDTIFRSYFPDTEYITFLNFIRQGGADLDLSKINTQESTASSKKTYTLNEVKYGLKKTVRQRRGDDVCKTTYKDSFASIDYLEKDYWEKVIKAYGEDDIYRTVQWLNATLDEKRQIILENYINQITPLYPSSAEDGYESLYLRAEGSLDYVDLSVENTSSVELQISDTEWDDFSDPPESPEEYNEIMQAALEDECGSFTEGVEIWNWFSAIMCWLGNLGGSSTSGQCSSGDCAQNPESENIANQTFSEAQKSNPELQVFLASEQNYASGYNALQKVFVYTTSSVNADNIELAISHSHTGEQGIIVGENPVKLDKNGKGFTYVKALNPDSVFSLYVKSPQNYKSNLLNFTTNIQGRNNQISNNKTTTTETTDEDREETTDINWTDILIESAQKYKFVFLNEPTHIPYNSKEVKLSIELQNGDSQAIEYDLIADVELTEASQKYAILTGSTTLDFSQKALQTISLQTFRETGPIHLLVKSQNPDIASIGIEIKVANLLTKENISELKPQTLYTTLLGNSYADLIKTDNVANRFLFSAGKTQAVTSLQGTPYEYSIGANIYPSGRLEIFNDRYLPIIESINPLTISVFNQTEVQKELSYEIVFSETTINLGEFTYTIDSSQPGAYLMPLDKGILQLKQNADEVILEKKDFTQILKITNQGEFTLANGYKLGVNTMESNKLILEILFEKEVIANLILMQTELSKILSQNSTIKEFFAEGTTKGSIGYSVLDKSENKQKIGLGSNEDLVSAKTTRGIGWKGDYKNALLYAANNNIGSATKNYSSVFEVLLGDPTIKLKNITTAGSNHFNQTLGKQIFTNHDKQIVGTYKTNFNNDDCVDLGIVYSDGYVELLQGSIGHDLKSKGNLAYLNDLIKDSQSIDFKSDGYEDLLVITDENDLQILQNDEQFLNIENIQLNLDSQITKFELAKMSADENLDLVTAMSNGDIRIFYGNANGTFTATGVLIDQLGGTISKENLASEVNLNSTHLVFDEDQAIELEISQPLSSFDNLDGYEDLAQFASEYTTVELVQPDSQTEKVALNFISGDQVSEINVTKTGSNLSGEFVDIGDIIEYTTTLTTATQQDSLMLTSYVPSNFRYLNNSLKIQNCGENIDLNQKVYTSNYPFLIQNISLAPGQICTFSYQVSVTQTPQINFWIEDIAIENTDQNTNNVITQKFEKFDFLVKKAQAEDLYAKDGYLDIGINVEGNTTGKIKYLISQEPHSHEYIEVYTQKEKNLLPDKLDNTDTDGNGIPDKYEIDEDGDGIADFINDYQNSQVADEDEDGLPDSWDSSDNNENSFSLNGLTNSLNSVIDFLEGGCKGGCLNLPFNYAFFAPGPIVGGALGSLVSRLGFPIGVQFTPPLVMPIFAWGHYYNLPVCITSPFCAVAFPQPVWYPLPIYTSMVAPMCHCSGGALIGSQLFSWMLSLGRIYLSPTLTGGIGLAVCFGPLYPFGKCIATALDSITGSLCDLIGLSGNDAKSHSNEMVLTNGQSLFSVGIGASSSQSGGSGGYNITFDLDSFSFSKLKDLNRNVKTIGNIITRWVNRQIEEVANALLDLPTIYLYYPTFDRIFEIDTTEESTETETDSFFDKDWGEFNKLKQNTTVQKAEQGIAGIKTAYNTIKSIPFITITRKDIKIKIPYLNKESLEALKNDLKNWKTEAKKEFEETKAEWKAALNATGESFKEMLSPPECQVDTENLSLECKHKLVALEVMLNAEKLMQSIEKNLEILESYANLPREIIKYKEYLLNYLTQVACTLNQIIDLLGGWIVKNLIRYNLWKKFILTLRTILECWQKILDVMIGYKNSCETCKAETYQFNLWSLLMSLIPEPPIIKFPRWPDIKIDLSQINANFEIVLPRLHFIPDPILFPKIPNLRLPGPPTFGVEFNLDLDFDLPAIPLLPDLPSLPTLPDLPSFSLPNLPDLPPPPKLPEVPGIITSLLDLIDVLLKIYCLIKKGFWIYDEFTIKSTLEALTSRPSGFMELFDFLHLNLPNFNIAGYNLLIESQVNLELDADYVAEAVDSAVEPWNSLVTNLTNQADYLNDDIYHQLKELVNQQDYLPDAVKENVQEELDNLNQETENSLEGLDSDLKLQTNASILDESSVKNIFEEMQAEIKKHAMFELDYDLIAGLESPNLRRTQKIAKIIEDYQTEVKAEIELLEKTNDLDFIAKTPQKYPTQLANYFTKNKDTNITTNTQYFTSISSTETNQKRLLAQTLPSNINELDPSIYPTTYGEQITDLDALSANEQSPTYNYQGAYIYDKATDQVQSLLKYKEEADSINSLLYFDYDRDGDDDIIYHMGADLYLKENFKNNNKATIIYPNTPQISDFDSLYHILQSVKNYKIENLNNKKTTVSWDKYQHTELTGYLLVTSNTINETTTTKKNYHYLIPQETNLNVTINGVDILLGDSASDSNLIQINNHLELELTDGEHFYTDTNEDEYYEFNLPNGFYYSTIYAIFTDGSISTKSETRLLAPQIAADEMSPLIIAPQSFSMYLNQIKTLSRAFFLDDSVDALSFSWSTEKTQPIASTSNGLEIGPYDEPQNVKLDLSVTDTAGNQAETQIQIKVFSPDLTLNSAMLKKEKTISGKDNPLLEDIPVTIYRERLGKTKIIKTPSANLNGKYFTNEVGEYSINDFNFDTGVIIKDNQNNEIAYINAPTGQIELKNLDYSLKILAATNVLPTRVVILNSAQKVVANQYFVANYNNDVAIDDFQITTEDYIDLEGVHIYDANLQDNYQFASIPGNAPNYPGGVTIFNEIEKKNLVLVNVDGKIYLPEYSTMHVELKSSKPNEPVIFEIRDNTNALIGEIYIATSFEDETEALEILPDQHWSQVIAQFFLPKPVIIESKFAALDTNKAELPFSDINQNHPAYEAIKELYERRILSGYDDGTVRPDTKISRSEFVKIALGATTCLDCTTPTENEKSRYDTNQPFPDVAHSAWYYYCISKGKEKSMITGYGDGYFRPEQNISRAEAVAILLREAGVVVEEMPSQFYFDIPDYAWYKDYIYTGVQLGIISTNYGFIFPDEKITRGEFAMMAKNLLNIQDCRLIDSDLDGMPDYWEIQNGLDPNNLLDGSLDNDKDGIVNSQEFKNDTDPNQNDACPYLDNPNQKDTDEDGIIDVCDEDIDNDSIKNLLGIYDETGNLNSQKENSSQDNCVFVVNQKQTDQDQDGIGDVCDTVDNNENGDSNSNSNDYGNGNEDNIDLCPFLPGNNQGCPEIPISEEITDSPGIYIVPGDPTECYFIDYVADLRKGDQIYTAISSEDNKTIWSKSEVVEY